MKNNNSNFGNRNNSGNNAQGQNYNHQSQHDRRKQNNPQSHHHHHQQQQQTNSDQHHNQRQSHTAHQRDHGPRERSSQRNMQAGGNYNNEGNMNRDNMMPNATALGSIKFTPGLSTRELPPIETKADAGKKFTGRCRLFVGNLPHNTSEERLRKLFEVYGEIGELFLGPKSAFAFIKMDTRQNAEKARDALDCSVFEGRTLRVRLAAHAAAIRVKHLSSQVTNELLAYAFRYFGEIERAVVVVDDKGKSTGEGIVEYSKKQSALYAMKRCQQECFMLSSSPQPVLVEPFDQRDEDEGLPEKSINKYSNEFKEQREVGPRFAEQGTFEHTFALRWKDLYEVEKQKRDQLEQQIQEARKNLQDQIEYSKLEHDTIQLRNRLQQLEDDRMKLQQMKEQTLTGAHHREEQRRQQDMLIRQREEDILRRQQLMNDGMQHQQQEANLRMQNNAIQEVLNQEAQSMNMSDSPNETSQPTQPQQQQSQDNPGNEVDNGMIPFQLNSQPRTFADAAMMGLNNPNLIPVQTHLGLAPPLPPQNVPVNPPNMFTPYMPQNQMQQMNSNYQPNYVMMPQQQAQGNMRQQKYGPRYSNNNNNNSNNNTSNNNRNQGDNNSQSGRPRKRGRY